MSSGRLEFIRRSVWWAGRQFARVVPSSSLTQGDVLAVATTGVVLGISLLSHWVVLVMCTLFMILFGRDYLKVRSRVVDRRSRGASHTMTLDLEVALAVRRAERTVVLLGGLIAWRVSQGRSPALALLLVAFEVATILMCGEDEPGGTTVWSWLASKLNVGVPALQPAITER